MCLPGDLLTSDAAIRFDLVGVVVVAPFLTTSATFVATESVLDPPGKDLGTVSGQPVRFAFLNDTAYIDGVWDPVFC